MSKELEEQLYFHLGELMHGKDSTFDWYEKDKIIAKINAVYVLLDIDKREDRFHNIMDDILKEVVKHDTSTR